MKEQIKKLANILGIGGLNGAVPVAALAGLFKPENALMLSFAFIAGPGSIVTALCLDGPARQRMLAALLAGIIATSVLAILGIGLLIVSGVNITGNVIGSSFNNSTGILAGLLFLVASFLIFRKKE